MPERHAITGCRVDTIFDLWLHPYDALYSYVTLAWAMIERGELAQYADKSKEMDEQQKQRPYIVDGEIAHVTISGPMTKYPTSFQSLFGGTSTMRVREALKEIKQNAAIRGVLIHADSWGGTAEGTSEAAVAIRELNKVKSVFVHAEDKATSAMLWCAVMGTQFTCGPMASVGSQGTMTLLYDTSKSPEKPDAKPILISTGKFKGIGAPGLPVTEEHRQELQRRIDLMNEPFKHDVISARRLTAKQAEEVATARVFVGNDALRVGLVDVICTTDEAVADLKQFISTGAVSRSPASNGFKPAAPKRSPAMALTAEQLKQARELPGAANLDENNPDVGLLAVATKLTGDLKTAQQDRSQANDRLVASQLEVDRLKALVPIKMDTAVAKAAAQVAIDRVELMTEKGLLLPTQAQKLKNAFMTGETPNEAFLSAGIKDVVFDVLKDNKPNGVLNDVSGAQPAPKQTPGDTEERKTITFQRANELRAEARLDPLTREQYKNKYGVDAA